MRLIGSLAALLALVVGCTPLRAKTTGWDPPGWPTWQIQLTGTPDLSVPASVYDLDAYGTAAATVAALHAAKRKVLCHLDVGTADQSRPAAAGLSRSLLGAPAGPGRRWLDIRRPAALVETLSNRLTVCRDKGFDGVDADGVDAYRAASGFRLTAQQQLAFDRTVIGLARGMGLAAGLRLPPQQADARLDGLTFVVINGCLARGDCAAMGALTGHGIAVYDYELQPVAGRCGPAQAFQIVVIQKQPTLDAWRGLC